MRRATVSKGVEAEVRMGEKEEKVNEGGTP